MEVRDRQARSKHRPPPPLAPRSYLAASSSGAGRSSSADEARAWRPASGFASKHQAEQERKRRQRQQQRELERQRLHAQQEEKARAAALAAGPAPRDVVVVAEGEWRTVVSHGRRGRAERRTQNGSLPPAPPPPSPPSLSFSRSLDAASFAELAPSASLGASAEICTNASPGEKVDAETLRQCRRQQMKRKLQAKTAMNTTTTNEDEEAGPHPSLLGEVMFARRSSLQRLMDELHVDDDRVPTPTSPPSRQWPVDLCHSNSSNGHGMRRTKSSTAAITQNDVATAYAECLELTPTPVPTSGYRSTRRSASPPSNSAETKTPPPKKCGDKRDFFFRNLDFELRNQLQVDEVAEFSVTDYEMATRISEAVLGLFIPPEFMLTLAGDGNDGTGNDVCASTGESKREKYPLVVTDGTACIGGNVLSFCDFFLHVNAIEFDATRAEMLRHNLQVLGKTNATCLHASYLDVMLELQQDVVFLDPPWGGPEYKAHEKVDLFLGGVPLYDICTRLHGRAKCVVLKVPSNFDSEKFASHVPGRVVIRRDLKKMHLVILDFRGDGSVY